MLSLNPRSLFLVHAKFRFLRRYRFAGVVCRCVVVLVFCLLILVPCPLLMLLVAYYVITLDGELEEVRVIVLCTCSYTRGRLKVSWRGKVLNNRIYPLYKKYKKPYTSQAGYPVSGWPCPRFSLSHFEALPFPRTSPWFEGTIPSLPRYHFSAQNCRLCSSLSIPQCPTGHSIELFVSSDPDRLPHQGRVRLCKKVKSACLWANT